MPLDQALIDAFREGRAAVFVGAGVSASSGLLGWDALVTNLAAALGDVTPPATGTKWSADMLLKVPQYFVNRYGRARLVDILEKDMRQARPSALHLALAQLDVDLFYTTNFDKLLERALEQQGVDFDRIHNEDTARQYHRTARRVRLRKFHGTIDDGANLVLCQEDFENLEHKRPIQFQRLIEDLKSRTFFFIGYSLRDPDFNALYDSVRHHMGDMGHVHYVCVGCTPSSHEIYDLRRRGLMHVSTEAYPGTRAERDTALVNDLIDQTSERFHIRRFFEAISAQPRAHIVITAFSDGREGWTAHPACDVLTAFQLVSDLHKIGVKGIVVPDRVAMRDVDRYLADNVILVCSPFGNALTREFFSRQPSPPQVFEDIAGGTGRQIRHRDGSTYHSDDPSTGRPHYIEHALIARYQNPWSAGCQVYVFAGCQAIGTHAIGQFLAQADGYRHLTAGSAAGELVRLLPLTYATIDHDDYKYQVSPLVPLR